MPFMSTKIYDGFSTCFRQWKAEDTHCKFLHGYGVSIKIVFKGEIDEKNWVFDFGGMKRAIGRIDGMTPKEWFDYMFDHTVIIAMNDPELEQFDKLANLGIIQLRVIPDVGAEKFAEYIYNKINEFIVDETYGRVKVSLVEFRENEKNSAIYYEVV